MPTDEEIKNINKLITIVKTMVHIYPGDECWVYVQKK